jgi:hypothetical protein
MVCSMCLSIFNQEPRPISTQQTAYHQTLTSLQHSVDAKCPICTYLWELISKARPNTNTTSASAFGDLVGQTPYQSSADGNLQNIEYHFSQTPDAYHTPQVRFQMCSGEHIADLYLLNHLGTPEINLLIIYS